MDDEIAVADVVRQLLQQREASLLKILLDLDLERAAPGRRQVIGQLQPVRLELTAHARQEQFHDGPSIGSEERLGLGMSDHLRPDLRLRQSLLHRLADQPIECRASNYTQHARTDPAWQVPAAMVGLN